MLRRLAGVLTGFLLLSTGGYFSWRVVEGWQHQASGLSPARRRNSGRGCRFLGCLGCGP